MNENIVSMRIASPPSHAVFKRNKSAISCHRVPKSTQNFNFLYFIWIMKGTFRGSVFSPIPHRSANFYYFLLFPSKSYEVESILHPVPEFVESMATSQVNWFLDFGAYEAPANHVLITIFSSSQTENGNTIVIGWHTYSTLRIARKSIDFVHAAIDSTNSRTGYNIDATS